MIFGLVGFIGSGKGTVGDILVQDHGFIRESFAAPLKDAVANIFGWSRALLEGDTKESREWRERPDPFWSKQFGRDFTPREALQLMGTEAGREVFHPNLWIASLTKRVESYTTNVVVTDVRFKNEIAAIQKIGGIIIRVVRGPEPEWYEIAARGNNGHPPSLLTMQESGIHPSEWDWVGTEMDHTIKNDGTLEDLKGRVEFIIMTERFITSMKQA